MDFLDLANCRYTTKRYNPDLKISDDKIDQLKEILRLCPSSIDCQPWQFIFISDEELKNKLASESYFNEHKIQETSHLVVFNVINNIADLEKRIYDKLPQGSIDYYNNHVKSRPEAFIKEWMACQVYLSLGYFLSACASMGIDSTPMEGINSKEYEKILQIKGFDTLFAVAIGYRDENDNNQPSVTPKSRLALDEVIKSL